MPEATRQLAAIMFTDIVGYTALMGKDSAKALELIRISKEIQKPLVEKHNGKWLKEMGDGAMAQFSTALDAVNCSIEIQEVARAKLDGKLRIGIHSGDITIEDDDVYGDGVNVASRLESIADPGGIYISDNIEKAIQGQSDVQAKYLGEVKLKNVAYGVRTYALQGVGLPVPEVKDEKELSGHFLAELQRRGVLRAGATYVVLSLLLILLVPYVRQLIELPQWFPTALFTLLTVGLPLALYFAWNFERSPEGFVRTSSKESWQNPYTAGQRKPLTGNFIVIGLILVIITMYVFPRLSKTEDSTADTTVTIDDKTIAVIPFINMSDDPAQEYFSDGMMEEILNHLVQIEDLMVTSRTTAMRYKGSGKSIQEIGKELGVAHVLEGSVRKQGNRVRITVQLIDVSTDLHLWSNSYDRNLDDVFAIQSEVAQLVASSLQAQVHPEIRIRIESQPTPSSEAYNLHLEALFQKRLGTEEGRQKAIELWEQAIQIDPKFADAYVDIGWTKSMFAWGGKSMVESPAEAVEVLTSYLQKAFEIDPNNLSSINNMATMRLWYEWDFEAAEKFYKTGLRLNPNASWPGLFISTGRFEEAAKQAERRVEINRLDPWAWTNRILSLYFNHQHKEALQTIDTALVLNVNFRHANIVMEAARVYLYLEMYQKAIEMAEQLIQDYNIRSPRPLSIQAISYYHLGELNKSNELLGELTTFSKESSAGSPSFYIAMIYAQMGEIDSAFEWLDKAYEDHEVEMYWLKVEPPFEPLHDDPRWQEMLDKVGFPE